MLPNNPGFESKDQVHIVWDNQRSRGHLYRMFSFWDPTGRNPFTVHSTFATASGEVLEVLGAWAKIHSAFPIEKDIWRSVLILSACIHGSHCISLSS